MKKVSVFIKIRVLFWPEISALGVFFNFDNERMSPPKYPSAPPPRAFNNPKSGYFTYQAVYYTATSFGFILFSSNLGGARLVLLLKERAFRVGNHGNIC